MKDNRSVRMLWLRYVGNDIRDRQLERESLLYIYTIQTGLCKQAEHRRWQWFCLMADMCKDT